MFPIALFLFIYAAALPCFTLLVFLFIFPVAALCCSVLLFSLIKYIQLLCRVSLYSSFSFYSLLLCLVSLYFSFSYPLLLLCLVPILLFILFLFPAAVEPCSLYSSFSVTPAAALSSCSPLHFLLFLSLGAALSPNSPFTLDSLQIPCCGSALLIPFLLLSPVAALSCSN